MTKVPKDMKDYNILEYNLILSKKYGGKIPNYLLPIGHTKEQKHHSIKMKEYFEKRFSTIEHKGTDSPQTPRNKSAVSRFKTVQIERGSFIQSKSKFFPTPNNISIDHASIYNSGAKGMIAKKV
jgi:hypothetical protein